MMPRSSALLQQDLAFDFRQPAAGLYLETGCRPLPGRRSRGGLDLALHKPANIAHGDGEIVLSLQVDPELRSVTEISADT